MKSQFKKNSIVWAKAKGHPWWPGTVIKVTDSEFVVNFIGDNSQQGCKVSAEHVVDFQEKLNELGAKPKNKKLKHSIELAVQMTQKHTKKHSESEEECKKRTATRVTRIQQKKKPEPITITPIESQQHQKQNQLDREFQDLLLLLVASQLNYDQIRLKLNPILDTIEGQIKQHSEITEILSDKKGSILNAVFMILKHQSECNPDHFFQRDVQQQIARLMDLLLKLKQSLVHQFFDPNSIIKDLSQCYQNKTKMLQEVMNQKSEIIEHHPTPTPPVILSQHNIQQQPPQSLISKESPQQQDILGSFPPKRKNKQEIKQEKEQNKKIRQALKQEQANETQVVQVVHKKSNKKHEINDTHLRRKVCVNMLKYIELYGIEVETAKSIVIKIEQQGRDADHTMKAKYGTLMWNSLNNLESKQFKKEDLLKWVDGQQDNGDIWNRLTSSVSKERRLTN